MENYPYSYPESHDSSPRSRDNESWDDQQPPSSYKVKFMCSYGGKIHPRPNDNQLAYVGGETKIFAVDRNIRFSTMISKLSTLYSSDYNEVSFKYQLPGEDLDALISVTNDEDLDHMMLEYDRLYRSGGSSRPARLRLFLFPLISSNQSSFSADDPKPNQQWFVDALNSVPIHSLDSSASPAASATDSDFLFGFEKQRQQLDQPSPIPPVVVATKFPDPKLETAIPEAKIVIGDDHRTVGNDSMYEIDRQIHDLQRLQISKQEQHHLQQHHHQQQAAMFQRKNEENLNLNLNLPRGGGFHGDYYMPEKQPPTGVPVAVPVPATMPVPQTAYWQQQQQQHDRHMNVTGAYSDPISGTERLQQHQHQQQLQQQHQQQLQQQLQQQQQQQVYLIPSQGGMYQTPATNARQVTGQVGQGGYYGMQRVVPDVYREQPVYTMGPPGGQQQMQQAQPQMQKMMMGETTGPGGGYATTQVGYDSTGRQVYYTTTSTGAPSGGVVPSSYPTAVTTMPVDPRQPGPLNQEGKVLKPAQANV